MSALNLKPEKVRKAATLTFSKNTTLRKASGGGTCSRSFKDQYTVGAKLYEHEDGDAAKKVFVCKGRTSGVGRAVKMIRKTRWDKEDSLRTFHEYDILQRLDHRHLLKMYEHYEGAWQHYFLMELCAGGNFGEELDSLGHLTEEDAALLVEGLLSCMNYCHHNNVIHGNLTPEHILLIGSRDLEQIKVCGFGSSILMDSKEKEPAGESSSSPTAARPTKSLLFMAPEVFQGTVTTKSDIWSIGVIAYLALSNKLPFSIEQLSSTNKEESAEEKLTTLDFSEECWEKISQEAKDFIQSLLVLDADARPTAKEASKNPWIHNLHFSDDDKAVYGRRKEGLGLFQNFKSSTRSLVSTSRLKQAVNIFISSQLLLKEERANIDRVFRTVDITNDGKLTKEEVRAAFIKYYSFDTSIEKLDKVFERIDTDNNGYLEYSEFVIAVMSEMYLLKDQKLRKSFDFFDVDKSGYISAADLKQVLGTVAQTEEQKKDATNEKVINDMIAEVDKDGDGQLSYQEFLAMMVVNVYKNEEDRKLKVFGNRGLAKNFIQRGTSIRFGVKDFVGKNVGKLNEQYQMHNKLEEGRFGQIYRCTHRATGEERNIKVVNKHRYDKNQNDRVEREFQMLKELDHPNILQMYQLFDDGKHFFIVMDPIKIGRLRDELDNWGAIPEGEATVVMRQLLSSINYCHSQHIVHCNVKPDNILFEHGKDLTDIVLMDFSYAQYYKDDTKRLNLLRGTLEYMAPEVLDKTIPYGPKCDIWSCGVIAYLILSNRFPFGGADRAELKKNILKGVISLEGEPWDNLSESAQDFVQWLLTVNQRDRPSAQEALAHEWIAGARAVGEDFRKSTANNALGNFAKFNSRQNKLRQATISLIGAQLLMKKEKESIDDIFRALDVDSNGRLSKEETQRGYEEFFNHSLTEKEIDDLFERADADGSGYIEYSEFVVAAMNENDLFSKTKLEAAFKVFDKNGDGAISTAEFLNVLKSHLDSETSAEEDVAIQRIMEEADANKDGLITFDDFVALMMMSADDFGVEV